MACLCCGYHIYDIHHIKTRKSGGPDLQWNMAPLCRTHHVEIHKKGLQWMCQKYPALKDYIAQSGWSYNEKLKKWLNENM